MNNNTSSNFFLSVNSPNGVFSIFKELYKPNDDWFCYILKGGPGTGKSTLMKKIAEKSIAKGNYTELIHCSSDPNSLDAVIIPCLKTAIVDGTSPHTLDPTFPGLSDIVINLCDCWNSKKLLKHKSALLDLYQKNKSFHDTSKKYLHAYGQIDKEMKKIIENCTLKNEIPTYCEKFSKKIFKNSSSSICSEKLRFISSITPSGHICFEESLISQADKTFIIEDNFSVVGNLILQNLRNIALNHRLNITTCLQPLAPDKEIEAIIIPELKVAFKLENPKALPLKLKNKIEYKKISTKKFLNTTELSKHKNLIALNRKICKELLYKSVNNLHNALLVHNEIEEFYKSSINYSKLDKITNKILSAIT